MQIDDSARSSLKFEQTSYARAQLHFHMPSEHTFDGGSLTVPPCTEGVTWLVVAPSSAVIEVSHEQLSRLSKALAPPTNRPLHR